MISRLLAYAGGHYSKTQKGGDITEPSRGTQSRGLCWPHRTICLRLARKCGPGDGGQGGEELGVIKRAPYVTVSHFVPQFSNLSNGSYILYFLIVSTRACILSHSVAWLLCPWDLPGENTGTDSHFLLQGIFPTGD